MNGQFQAVLFIVVVTIALTGIPATGQESTAAGDEWAPPQTPWGDPDLQGIWGAGYIVTPLERRDEYDGREFLTEEEVVSLEAAAAATFGIGAGAASGTLTGRPEKGTVADVEGAYNDVYSGRGVEVIRTRRTSLIVDPPDGKIPYTPEAKSRLAAESQARRANRGRQVADGPEDRRSDRCLGITLPVRYGSPATSGGYSRIVQTPGHLGIYYEHGHHGGAYRSVSLDGRPHLPSDFRQWLGDAVGRWDGDTLEVDTTNFTAETNYQGSRKHLHLIERFTHVAVDLIMYRATIEDPTVFARPWTIEVPLTRKDNVENQIYESACHEGNYALTGILAGARTVEQWTAER